MWVEWTFASLLRVGLRSVASRSCPCCFRVRTISCGWTSPPGDDEAVRVLSEVFRFHPLAVRDAMERNRVPKMHAYHDHVFVILHAPERGEHGHVHYIELDQFIGLRYLVT